MLWIRYICYRNRKDLKIFIASFNFIRLVCVQVSSQHVAVTAEGGVKIEAVGNTASPGFSFGKADMAPKEKRAATGEESVADIAAAAVERASVTQPGFGGRSVAFGKRLENASDFDTS